MPEPKVKIRADLPVIPNREPSCPSAARVEGACSANGGVICRAMQRDQEDDAGLNMTAGQLSELRDGDGGVFMTLKSDPSTLTMFCYGNAVPVVTDDDGQGRASYTYCSTWQTARNRELAGLDGLTDDVEPEPVSMGMDEPVASHEAADPLAAGVAGLGDLLETANPGDLMRLANDPAAMAKRWGR